MPVTIAPVSLPVGDGHDDDREDHGRDEQDQPVDERGGDATAPARQRHARASPAACAIGCSQPPGGTGPP